MESIKRKHKCLDNKSHKRFKLFPSPFCYKPLPPIDLSKFKGIPFEKLLEEFKANNSDFLESLRLENSVLKSTVSPKYSFGNYESKYPWGDPRIPFIPNELVKNKKCLDIGHGNGEFAIQLAIAYNPEIIIGCDIDPILTKQAISKLNLRKGKFIEKGTDIWNKLKELPKSFDPEIESRTDNILFLQENYISSIQAKATFDTVICLKTIPWIHLNYGDVGILALFYKIYMNLKENGSFIFDKETMEKYRKKARKSPELKQNLSGIQFLPNMFIEFLTDILKYTIIEQRIKYDSSVLEEPIFILKKNVF